MKFQEEVDEDDSEDSDESDEETPTPKKVRHMIYFSLTIIFYDISGSAYSLLTFSLEAGVKQETSC